MSKTKLIQNRLIVATEKLADDLQVTGLFHCCLQTDFIVVAAFASNRVLLWIRNEMPCDRETHRRGRPILRVMRSKLKDTTRDRPGRWAINCRTDRRRTWCGFTDTASDAKAAAAAAAVAGYVYTSFVSLRLQCQHQLHGWTVNGALERIRLIAVLRHGR